MAQGLFITGFSGTEVLQIQAKAKEMLFEGETLMALDNSGSNATKQFTMPVKDAFVPPTSLCCFISFNSMILLKFEAFFLPFS